MQRTRRGTRVSAALRFSRQGWRSTRPSAMFAEPNGRSRRQMRRCYRSVRVGSEIGVKVKFGIDVRAPIIRLEQLNVPPVAIQTPLDAAVLPPHTPSPRAYQQKHPQAQQCRQLQPWWQPQDRVEVLLAPHRRGDVAHESELGNQPDRSGVAPHARLLRATRLQDDRRWLAPERERVFRRRLARRSQESVGSRRGVAQEGAPLVLKKSEIAANTAAGKFPAAVFCRAWDGAPTTLRGELIEERGVRRDFLDAKWQAGC